MSKEGYSTVKLTTLLNDVLRHKYHFFELLYFLRKEPRNNPMSYVFGNQEAKAGSNS